MLGNGNFGALSSYPVDQQAKYVELYKKLGYRFVLNSVTLPTSVNSGASLTISSAWSNVGVTPAYHPWQTYYQLINPSTNTVEWEGKSSVSLETFLPTLSAPVSATDTFVLPSTLKSGNYEVYVMVKDPDGYYKPLNLSIVGRTTNGNYKIGQIQVVSGIGTIAPTPTVVVTPTNTPIPTFTPTPTKLPTPTPTPISASPIIATTSLANATRGRSYTATVNATDATISDTLSMTVMGLPTGITLKTCATTSSFSGTKLTCTISGTPTSRKSYYPVFTVRDLSGKTGTKTLRLQVR